MTDIRFLDESTHLWMSLSVRSSFRESRISHIWRKSARIALDVCLSVSPSLSLNYFPSSLSPKTIATGTWQLVIVPAAYLVYNLPLSLSLSCFLSSLSLPQSDFIITEDYCYWELSSVIVPTAYLVDYLEKEEARGKELKGKEKDLKGWIYGQSQLLIRTMAYPKGSWSIWIMDRFVTGWLYTIQSMLKLLSNDISWRTEFTRELELVKPVEIIFILRQ